MYDGMFVRTQHKTWRCGKKPTSSSGFVEWCAASYTRKLASVFNDVDLGDSMFGYTFNSESADNWQLPPVQLEELPAGLIADEI